MTEISNYAKYRVTGPGQRRGYRRFCRPDAAARPNSVLTAPCSTRPAGSSGESPSPRAHRCRRVLPLRLARAESTTRAGSPPTCRPTGPRRSRCWDVARRPVDPPGPARRGTRSTPGPAEDLSSTAVPIHGFPRDPRSGSSRPSSAGSTTAASSANELWVAPEYQRALFDLLMAAGEEFGIRLFGFRALMSLRLEKSYGTW
jgi:dimethylglycine dehydrogenase